ncbi:DUF4192 domain-containing protein [Phytoactinopolyspora alkaliphila]|uniref:DUF4192 domain-containing protein n=1 Tax=Phytoactinopolyspora alkaliphila TaxID=1783498 RepID=A0A6N9YJD9_9ACTN|nr:DUF4192 domain-containing protein [Phytoactinopolyspora alkaliphila]NED94989.1 DUF4192 domain-containing protein [Phytoactinopolyspora alkaliphila]
MKSNQTKVKVSLKSPSEIISVIPRILGFHPAESLVILCMAKPGNEVGLVLRADLPDPGCSDDFAAEIAARAGSDDVGQVVLVWYTSRPDDGDQLPGRVQFTLLADEFRRRDISIPEALLVRDGRWWSYTCAGSCCPRHGTALSPVNSDDVAAFEARRALDGAAVLPGREALAQSVSGPRGHRLAAVRQRIDETGPVFVDDVMNRGVDGARRHALETVRSALCSFADTPGHIDDAVAVRILLSLEDRWVRDALVTWGVDEEVGQFLAFLIALAQSAPDECCAPACTVLAAIAYQHGRGALAAVALERALRHEPDYRLARLLQALLAGQVDPAEIRDLARRARLELGASGMGGDRPAVA